MTKNNGSGGARRVKKATKKSAADPAPAPSPESIRDEHGKFLPGMSGNPAGRPQGAGGGPSLLVALRKRLEAHPEEVEQIVTTLVSMARSGDLKAIEIVGDRLDGKPTQRSEITGADGGPVVNVIHQEYQPEESNGNGNRATIVNRLVRG